jgi:hypothetical protein
LSDGAAELASIAWANTRNGVGRGTFVAVGVLPEGVFLPADWQNGVLVRIAQAKADIW